MIIIKNVDKDDSIPVFTEKIKSLLFKGSDLFMTNTVRRHSLLNLLHLHIPGWPKHHPQFWQEYIQQVVILPVPKVTRLWCLSNGRIIFFVLLVSSVAVTIATRKKINRGYDSQRNPLMFSITCNSAMIFFGNT